MHVFARNDTSCELLVMLLLLFWRFSCFANVAIV